MMRALKWLFAGVSPKKVVPAVLFVGVALTPAALILLLAVTMRPEVLNSPHHPALNSISSVSKILDGSRASPTMKDGRPKLCFPRIGTALSSCYDLVHAIEKLAEKTEPSIAPVEGVAL